MAPSAGAGGLSGEGGGEGAKSWAERVGAARYCRAGRAVPGPGGAGAGWARPDPARLRVGALG